MSSPPIPEIAPGPRLASVRGADSAPRSPRHQLDSWLRTGAQVFLTFPLPGQSGQGRTAFVRRRPVRIADGRMEGGYTSVFELICPGCGDHPYLDFREVPKDHHAAKTLKASAHLALTSAVAACQAGGRRPCRQLLSWRTGVPGDSSTARPEDGAGAPNEAEPARGAPDAVPP